MIITKKDILELEISKIILRIEKPFTIKQLYIIFEKKDIKDRDFIIYVLGQLYEKGLLRYTLLNNGSYAYENIKRVV